MTETLKVVTDRPVSLSFDLRVMGGTLICVVTTIFLICACMTLPHDVCFCTTDYDMYMHVCVQGKHSIGFCFDVPVQLHVHE